MTLQAPTTRTAKQNASFHLYCTMLAQELNERGLEMNILLEKWIDVPWSKDTVKSLLWKPILDVYSSKKSTTKMTTKETQEIFEILNRHLGEKFGVHVPWPSQEETTNFIKSYGEAQ